MKLVEIIADASLTDSVVDAMESLDPTVTDRHVAATGPDGRRDVYLVVRDEQLQAVLDKLQVVTGSQPNARILVLPIDASLPQTPQTEERKEPTPATAREVLYSSVEKDVRLDLNYLVLVALSTIVAAIGLVEDNVAVVIGAMVIAPLLGPNLALALGTALGDTHLVRKSIKTAVAGIGLAILLSVVLGMLWPFSVVSRELLARTDVGLDSVALALAAGAAAVLSLTTGLPSVLVGVMVAVALLPPAAALGLTLGHGRLDLAAGAALLLAVNIVCVNLASKVVFLLRGIRPRTWWQREKARRATVIYLVMWVVTLALLMLLIYARQKVIR